MPFGIKLFKKPWDSAPCEFVLQEYGLGGERGWSDVTESTGTLPSKDTARDNFKPGHHYRLLAKYVEGERAGQIAGVAWNHYEPAPGGLKPKEPIKREKSEAKRADPVAVMSDYAEEVERTLAPLGHILESLDDIRQRLGGGTPQRVVGEEEGMGIPPPEFDGKLPVVFHPYVIHTIAEEMKSVISYAGDRFEGILGKSGEAPPVKEEEEEPLLPSIKDYVKPTEAEVEEKEEEGELEEAEKPEEEEEEPSLPTLPSAPEAQKPTEEIVPALIEEKKEEELAECMRCGKAFKPTGEGKQDLCPKCIEELTEEPARAKVSKKRGKRK
jgi:hypothetical protein